VRWWWRWRRGGGARRWGGRRGRRRRGLGRREAIHRGAARTNKVAAGVAAVEMACGRGGFVADEAAHLARRVGGATRRKRARRAVREALLEGGRLEPAARKVGGTRHAGADVTEERRRWSRRWRRRWWRRQRWCGARRRRGRWRWLRNSVAVDRGAARTCGWHSERVLGSVVEQAVWRRLACSPTKLPQVLLPSRWHVDVEAS
jgi:hypothetical protein